jgi:hypothetical protein
LAGQQVSYSAACDLSNADFFGPIRRSKDVTADEVASIAMPVDLFQPVASAAV